MNEKRDEKTCGGKTRRREEKEIAKTKEPAKGEKAVDTKADIAFT